jgi:hypothetical protein
MNNELNDIEDALLDIMDKIKTYDGNTVTLDVSELKQWYKRLEDARFLVRDIMEDEGAKPMNNIDKLLKENKLSHYKFDEEKSRLVYNANASTHTHMNDYKRLIHVLKGNNIKHDAVGGMDVIFIEKD